MFHGILTNIPCVFAYLSSVHSFVILTFHVKNFSKVLLIIVIIFHCVRLCSSLCYVEQTQFRFFFFFVCLECLDAAAFHSNLIKAKYFRLLGKKLCVCFNVCCFIESHTLCIPYIAHLFKGKGETLSSNNKVPSLEQQTHCNTLCIKEYSHNIGIKKIHELLMFNLYFFLIF